jgi:hypothetical protein
MALAVMAGCSDAPSEASPRLSAGGDPSPSNPAAPPGPNVAEIPIGIVADATTPPPCTNTLPTGFVSLTGSVINGCIAGNTAPCSGPVTDPSQLALSYGSFPFDKQQAGTYFFAVVAEGQEAAGFFQGAVGNLSDDVPSSTPGDLGSGDSLGDRTISISASQTTPFFPTSYGTHPISFPPSQFMTIHLSPFDTTPSGKYVLVVCPMNATSNCECAFDDFSVTPTPSDAGAPDAGQAGAGGTAGSGGIGIPDSSTAGAAGVAGAGGAAGSGSGGAAGCHDM